MPSNITTYKVFIASPSDCGNERGLAREYIEGLNKDAYFKDKGASFEVLGWEDIPSAAGRPQRTINEAIKEEADLFVFFFWHRFGSDAGLGLTGTEEEFCRALNQLDNPHKLCFLVKDTDIPKKELDCKQYAQLDEFIKSIQEIVFYKTFENDDEFKKEIKLFLYTFIKKVHLKDLP